MTKKVHGICCICGQETELTFEHIPPRAAFNHFSLKLYDFWGYLLSNRTRYNQLQKGAGMYSLCERCNNLTGEWYGAAYAEFAVQGMRYYIPMCGAAAVPALLSIAAALSAMC